MHSTVREVHLGEVHVSVRLLKILFKRELAAWPEADKL